MRPLAGVPLGLALYVGALAVDVMRDHYPLVLSVLFWLAALAWSGLAVWVALEADR